jgi:hypothetical protein
MIFTGKIRWQLQVLCDANLLGGMSIVMLYICILELNIGHPKAAFVIGWIGLPPGLLAMSVQIVTCLCKKPISAATHETELRTNESCALLRIEASI